MVDTLDKSDLLLIVGESGKGKSASLRNIRDQEGVLYLNCDSGKRLPFRNKFFNITITNPWHVIAAIKATLPADPATNTPAGPQNGKFHTVIVDTLTFLLDMFESQFIYGASNGQQAWMDFQQFWKELMQQTVAKSDCAVIFIAHTLTTQQEKGGIIEFKTAVPVKGALKNNGIEAYFNTVVAAKTLTLKELENYKSDLLHITEEDEAAGMKYVFQTRITKSTTGERIRGPMGLFTLQQTFIDNDAQMLLDHQKAYYTNP